MKDIIDKLKNHRIWVESNYKQGEKLIIEEKDLRNINFRDYIFEQCSILDSDMSKVVLENVDFYLSWLCSTNFTETIINNCNFNKGELRYCNFDNAIIKNTKFHKGELWNTNFSQAYICNSSFVNTNCLETNFTDSYIENVDFTSAYFDRTLLKNVSLKKIIGINEITFVSINIGTFEEPTLLLGEDAKKWFVDKCR